MKEHEKITTPVGGQQRTVLATTILMVFLAFGSAVVCELSSLGTATPDHLLTFATNLVSTIVYLLLVPLTHLSGYLCYSKWRAFQPFSGGSRFILFQALAWSLYALSLVLSFAWFLKFGLVAKQAFGWLTSSGATGVLSQVFMISSLLVYEGSGSQKHKYSDNARAEKEAVGSAMTKPLASNGSFCHPFFSMHLLLAFSALVLSVASEYAYWLNQREFALLCAILSAAKYIVANFNSYGLGGRLLHLQNPGWTFWQPFSGGSRFVALQAASWITFSASLFLQLGYILQSLVFGVQCIAGITALAGLLCMSSQLLLVLSLPAFGKHDQVVQPLPLWVQNLALACFASFMINLPFIPLVLGVLAGMATGLSFHQSAVHGFGFFVYCMVVTQVGFGAWKMQLSKEWKLLQKKQASAENCHSPHRATWSFSKGGTLIFLGSILLVPALLLIYLFLISDNSWKTWLVLNAMFYPYAATYFGEPELTGEREILVDRNIPRCLQLPTVIADLFQRHFQGRVIQTSELDGNGQYILAMHPHGILPLTTAWLGHSSDWQKQFKGLSFHVLAATCVHMVPFLRDVLHWLGAREVSKKSFLRILKEGRSPFVIPGGQEEISHSRSNDDKFRLVTRHKGFLRLAMQHGVPVVPILSFGENDLLDALQMPTVQRWFIKKCGVFFPYFPYGSLGLPIPRNSPVTVVVGRPISTEKICAPSTKEVQDFALRYYDEIRRIFETYKVEAGYESKELVLI